MEFTTGPMLGEAMRSRDADLRGLHTDAGFAALRPDSRLQAFVRTVRLAR